MATASWEWPLSWFFGYFKDNCEEVGWGCGVRGQDVPSHPSQNTRISPKNKKPIFDIPYSRIAVKQTIRHLEFRPYLLRALHWNLDPCKIIDQAKCRYAERFRIWTKFPRHQVISDSSEATQEHVDEGSRETYLDWWCAWDTELGSLEAPLWLGVYHSSHQRIKRKSKKFIERI